MSDALFDLLKQYLPQSNEAQHQSRGQNAEGYLSRILSLRPSDLTTTEPESLQQSKHSNDVSIQALSSRTYRTTSTSFEHLKTLGDALPDINASVTSIRDSIPRLDDRAVRFGESYSRAKDANPAFNARKQSMLLSRQADKLQDVLELPSLLSTAITSASSSTSGGANYAQALDLFAHIKRLQILYHDSDVVKSVLIQAQIAMKDMTTNLIIALRGQNIRLAAAIRTIGWLRRLLPELSEHQGRATEPSSLSSFVTPTTVQQHEDDFGSIFLCARLCTFLITTEALAPLRDLADQETARRLQGTTPAHSDTQRKVSYSGHAIQGQQTERYLKRYIEVFREQSFATISMFRNVFPPSEETEAQDHDMGIPSALASFPLHLVEIFMEVIKTYLPNVVDPAARESLLMQVLYAANSLGRLGADFSMMVAFLDHDVSATSTDKSHDGEESTTAEPEWAKIIKKHRVQAARLEALAAGQDQAMSGRRTSTEIPVR